MKNIYEPWKEAEKKQTLLKLPKQIIGEWRKFNIYNAIKIHSEKKKKILFSVDFVKNLSWNWIIKKVLFFQFELF